MYHCIYKDLVVNLVAPGKDLLLGRLLFFTNLMFFFAMCMSKMDAN